MLDVRKLYGIECSEFSYEVMGDFTVADGWKTVNDIIGSGIVKRCGNLSIRFPLDVETAKTIDKFKLKNTESVFELAVKPSRMKELEEMEKLWNVIRENGNLIHVTEFIVEEREKESGGWGNRLTPDSSLKNVRDQVLQDYEEMVDCVGEENLDEEFIYKIQIFGDERFLPTFCDTQFIDEKRWVHYTGVSKKIGDALPSFNFDFKISFSVDWNIRYHDKYYREYREVYVDWCSLVIEKNGGKVSVYTEGHTDLDGQEQQIVKAIDRVTGKRVR